MLNKKGLPRPYIYLSDEQRKQPIWSKLILKNKLYLHKKIPVPWQSNPIFNGHDQFSLIKENEEKVYIKGVCAFCGIKFNKNDKCARWLTIIGIPGIEPNVFSDYYPFHIYCMKQARIFCPKMRQTSDDEFEYGFYKILKERFFFTFPQLKENIN